MITMSREWQENSIRSSIQFNYYLYILLDVQTQSYKGSINDYIYLYWLDIQTTLDS